MTVKIQLQSRKPGSVTWTPEAETRRNEPTAAMVKLARECRSEFGLDVRFTNNPEEFLR